MCELHRGPRQCLIFDAYDSLGRAQNPSSEPIHVGNFHGFSKLMFGRRGYRKRGEWWIPLPLFELSRLEAENSPDHVFGAKAY